MTMATYWDVFLYALFGGVVSLAGGIFLLTQKKLLERITIYAVPFAAGSLLAAVFLDLLKDGLRESSAGTVLNATLAGVVGFFIFERATTWFHHHHDEDAERQKNLPLIVLGNGLHNALDGVAIASAFLINVPTGIVTTVAVAAHEIPHEIGDFALMSARGMQRMQVLLANVAGTVATVIVALVTFWLGSSDKLPVGLLLGLSAGFLLYIAASDLIPSIHESAHKGSIIDLDVLMLLLGIAVVGASITLAHRYIEPEQSVACDASSSHCQVPICDPTLKFDYVCRQPNILEKGL